MAFEKKVKPRKPNGKHHDEKRIAMVGKHCPVLLKHWRALVDVRTPEGHDRREQVVRYWEALEALWEEVMVKGPTLEDSDENRRAMAARVKVLGNDYMSACRGVMTDAIVSKCLYVHMIKDHLADQVLTFGPNLKQGSGQGLENLNKCRKQWRLSFGNRRVLGAIGGWGRLAQNLCAGLIGTVVEYTWPTARTKQERLAARRLA